MSKYIYQICPSRIWISLLLFVSIAFLNLAPLQAQDEPSEDWETELEAAMEHLQTVLQENQVHIEEIQEHINEELMANLEQTMAELEVNMRLHESELREMESKIEQELSVHMKELEAHMKKMEVHMKEAESQVREHEQVLKDQLIEDGLIEQGEKDLHIRDKNGDLYINDRKLTPEQQDKYQKLIDEFERKVQDAFRFEEEHE